MNARRILPIAAMTMIMASPVASAGGINIGWSECLGMGGAINRSFACNTNAGTHELHLSFDPPVTIPDLVAAYATVDLQSAGTVLPPWWQFKNPGSCRLTSTNVVTGAGTCQDAWSNQGMASFVAYLTSQTVPSFPANRSRIVASVLVPTPLALHVDPGTEYMAMTIRINNAKTVGIGGCTGCLDPVCIIFIELLLSSANSGDIRIVYPLWSHFATWQGGVVLNMYGCPGGSPVTNQTWGGIKAIYR